MPEKQYIKRSNDPDMRNAEIAIQRAAQLAREKARRFQHGIIVYQQGEIIELLVNETSERIVPVDKLMKQMSLR